MKVVSNVNPPRRSLPRFVDYSELADYYNNAAVGATVDIGFKVANITNLRERIRCRGLTPDVDFIAYSRHGSSFVRKLTQAQMG